MRIASRITILVFTFFSATTSAQIPNYIPTNGLLGWWPFNGNANDESGNGNHGIVKGATLTSNIHNTANSSYEFNGTDNYIEIPNNNKLNSSKFTITAWVNAIDLNGFKQIITKNLGSSNNESINIVVNSDPSWNVTAQIGGNGYYGKMIQSPYCISTNEWHLLTFSYNDKIDSQFLYIDDKLVNQNKVSDTIQFDNKPWTIGAQIENGAMNYFFKGKIDNIAIWNRNLTLNEIIAIHNSKNCKLSINKQPQNQGCFNGNINFSVTSNDTLARYQWQTNQGTGWVSLSNAGQYNGVTTSTLTVNNVTSSNDGQLFRCIATGDCGKDTTREAKLSVWGVGVVNPSCLQYRLAPNPVKDILSVQDGQAMSGYQIYTITGQQILTGIFTESIDLRSLKSGVYLIRINGQIARLIKE